MNWEKSESSGLNGDTDGGGITRKGGKTESGESVQMEKPYKWGVSRGNCVPGRENTFMGNLGIAWKRDRYNWGTPYSGGKATRLKGNTVKPKRKPEYLEGDPLDPRKRRRRL